MITRRLYTLGILLLIVGLAVAGKPLDHQAEQTRPISLGVSGGNAEGPCFAGTLGCLVSDGTFSFILSNNHVFSTTVNKWEAEDRVTQPVKLDNVCLFDPSDVVALVYEVKQIDLHGGANSFDAGIAMVAAGKVDPKGRILGLGVPDPTVADAVVGLSVRKSGRTTRVTKGTVQFTNVNINVSYGSGQVGYFTNQIAIGGGGFSSSGDSGSLIMTADRKPVALLFAGGSGYTFASPIQPILDYFGVDVVGEVPSGGGGGNGNGNGNGGGGGKGKKPKAAKAQDRYGKSLLSRTGVVGHGLGKQAGRDVIAIFVETNTSSVRAKLPKSLDGVPVMIVETGRISAYSVR